VESKPDGLGHSPGADDLVVHRVCPDEIFGKDVGRSPGGRRDARADRLRVHAYSALETVLAVLQEFSTTNGGLHSSNEGWGTPLEFAGYAPPDGLTVEATIEDESGKISLPHADFQTLRDLFLLLGQKQSDAEHLADALMVWIQPGYEPVDSFSARATDYERETLPHDPPARSLHSFSELASIQFVRDTLYDQDGRPNELWRSFVDSVSLFDFNQPNTNSARVTTLAALGGYDEATLKMITEYLGGLGTYSRQGPAFFRNAQDVAGLVGQAAASARLGTQVRCLRVNVTVSEGSASFRVSAVVTLSGGAQLPPADQATASNMSTSLAASTIRHPRRIRRVRTMVPRRRPPRPQLRPRAAKPNPH